MRTYNNVLKSFGGLAISTRRGELNRGRESGRLMSSSTSQGLIRKTYSKGLLGFEFEPTFKGLRDYGFIHPAVAAYFDHIAKQSAERKLFKRKFDILIDYERVDMKCLKVRLVPMVAYQGKFLKPLDDITDYKNIGVVALPRFQYAVRHMSETLNRNMSAQPEDGILVVHELDYSFFKGGFLIPRVYPFVEK